jgi:hypothetical protein
VQSFLTTIRANAKTEIMKDIKQNGDFAVDYITRKIRNATSMDCGSPPYITDKITLKTKDVLGTETTTEIFSDVNSSACRIAVTETPPGTTSYLTSSNLNLVYSGSCAGAFSAKCELISSQPAKATFTFTLSQLDSPAGLKYYEKASQIFSTAVSLRNIKY